MCSTVRLQSQRLGVRAWRFKTRSCETCATVCTLPDTPAVLCVCARACVTRRRLKESSLAVGRVPQYKLIQAFIERVLLPKADAPAAAATARTSALARKGEREQPALRQRLGLGPQRGKVERVAHGARRDAVLLGRSRLQLLQLIFKINLRRNLKKCLVKKNSLILWIIK